MSYICLFVLYIIACKCDEIICNNFLIHCNWTHTICAWLFLWYTYLHANFICSFIIQDWLYIYVHGFVESTINNNNNNVGDTGVDDMIYLQSVTSEPWNQWKLTCCLPFLICFLYNPGRPSIIWLVEMGRACTSSTHVPFFVDQPWFTLQFASYHMLFS
jgi:hypothetical protein